MGSHNNAMIVCSSASHPTVTRWIAYCRKLGFEELLCSSDHRRLYNNLDNCPNVELAVVQRGVVEVMSRLCAALIFICCHA